MVAADTVPGDEKRVLLVVDDEESVLRFVKRLYRNSSKYEILTASKDQEALKLISSRDPDIVLMDIYLRHQSISGIECVKRARKSGYSGIICMFTGDPAANVLLESALAGADDFILKGPKCNLTEEIDRIMEWSTLECGPTSAAAAIEDGAFLRSRGLREEQRSLLAEYATLGYPRIKEFANQIDIPDYSLWKRLSRIRDKLGLDSMSKIAHLLTAVSVFGVTRANGRNEDF